MCACSCVYFLTSICVCVLEYAPAYVCHTLLTYGTVVWATYSMDLPLACVYLETNVVASSTVIKYRTYYLRRLFLWLAKYGSMVNAQVCSHGPSTLYFHRYRGLSTGTDCHTSVLKYAELYRRFSLHYD